MCGPLVGDARDVCEDVAERCLDEGVGLVRRAALVMISSSEEESPG